MTRPKDSAGDTATALRVTGLRKSYGSNQVLHDVSLEVAAGQVLCLVGANGSGKTTIVECIEGLRRPDAGRIEIRGQPYVFGRKRPTSLGVQLQEESLPTRIKVGEAVRFFSRIYQADRLPEDKLELLGIPELWNKKFFQLSGGQKRRTVVALALVGFPDLVILDEPASGLDPGGQEAVLRTIELLRAERVASLVTIHDLEQAAEMGDAVALLHEGKLLAQGAAGDLVATLGATTCVSLPAEASLPDEELAAAGVRRYIVHSGRTYLYGGDGLLTELASIRTVMKSGSRVETRAVGMVDVYLNAVGTPVPLNTGPPEPPAPPGAPTGSSGTGAVGDGGREADR